MNIPAQIDDNLLDMLAQRIADRMSQPRSSKTLEEFFDIYLKRHAALRCVDGGKETTAIFERYLTHLKDRPMSSITVDELSELHTNLANSIGFATANHALKVIKLLYNRAIRWQIYEGKNPALAVDICTLESRDRFLAVAEMKAFFDALDASESETFRDFVLLCIFTSARKTNVLQMRFEQIDWDLKIWRIPKQKNGKPHVIPLMPEVLEILERRRKKAESLQSTTHAGAKNKEKLFSSWVLPGPDPNKPYAQPYHAWTRLLKRAGIDNLSPHDLRRTFGSFMAATGASLPLIGNANHSSTAIYARLETGVDSPVRLAMQKATQQILTSAGYTGFKLQSDNPKRQAYEGRRQLDCCIIDHISCSGPSTAKMIHSALKARAVTMPLRSIISALTRLVRAEVLLAAKVAHGVRYYAIPGQVSKPEEMTTTKAKPITDKRLKRQSKNADIKISSVEQAIIEGKILVALRLGGCTKKSFYRKIGNCFQVNSFELERILNEMIDRKLIVRYRADRYDRFALVENEGSVRESQP